MPVVGKDKDFDEIQGEIKGLESGLEKELKKLKERVRHVTCHPSRSTQSLLERAPQS